MKPDSLQALAVDLARDAGCLIGRDHIAEIQEAHHDAAEAAARLEEVLTGLHAALRATADHDQQRNIGRDDRPIDDVQTE